MAVQVLLVGQSDVKKCVEAVQELLDALDDMYANSLALPTILIGVAATAAVVVGARGR